MDLGSRAMALALWAFGFDPRFDIQLVSTAKLTQLQPSDPGKPPTCATVWGDRDEIPFLPDHRAFLQTLSCLTARWRRWLWLIKGKSCGFPSCPLPGLSWMSP